MFHCLLSLLFVVVAITYYLGGYGDGACVKYIKKETKSPIEKFLFFMSF